MNIRTAFVGLAVVAAPALAKDFNPLDFVTLQRTSDPKLVPDAAVLAMQIPATAKSIFDIHGHLRFDLERTSGLTAGPSIEYHRNSGADAPQNFLKLGVTAEWYALDIIDTGWTPLLTVTGAFSQDWQSDKTGAQASVVGTWLAAGKGWTPNKPIDLGRGLKLQYAPLAALEYQGWYRGADSTQLGHVLRLRGGLSLSLLLFDNHFTLTASGDGRWGTREENGALLHGLGKASATVALTGEEDADGVESSAGLTFEYVIGSDPSNGFKPQSYFRTALSLRL